eukprot:TRINITY_DN50108_c0_g1_i1.p1 TRINITY_DN50108_c0_g1~~TRINITY_DN50108_c0_g1_i1.p1  ORF type:complete len:683 (+),score=72.04 TRINITY_DN50108_c0_g1_i1:163-2049(+)
MSRAVAQKPDIVGKDFAALLEKIQHRRKKVKKKKGKAQQDDTKDQQDKQQTRAASPVKRVRLARRPSYFFEETTVLPSSNNNSPLNSSPSSFRDGSTRSGSSLSGSETGSFRKSSGILKFNLLEETFTLDADAESSTRMNKVVYDQEWFLQKANQQSSLDLARQEVDDAFVQYQKEHPALQETTEDEESTKELTRTPTKQFKPSFRPTKMFHPNVYSVVRMLTARKRAAKRRKKEEALAASLPGRDDDTSTLASPASSPRNSPRSSPSPDHDHGNHNSNINHNNNNSPNNTTTNVNRQLLPASNHNSDAASEHAGGTDGFTSGGGGGTSDSAADKSPTDSDRSPTASPSPLTKRHRMTAAQQARMELRQRVRAIYGNREKVVWNPFRNTYSFESDYRDDLLENSDYESSDGMGLPASPSSGPGSKENNQPRFDDKLLQIMKLLGDLHSETDRLTGGESDEHHHSGDLHPGGANAAKRRPKVKKKRRRVSSVWLSHDDEKHLCWYGTDCGTCSGCQTKLAILTQRIERASEKRQKSIRTTRNLIQDHRTKLSLASMIVEEENKKVKSASSSKVIDSPSSARVLAKETNRQLQKVLRSHHQPPPLTPPQPLSRLSSPPEAIVPTSTFWDV